MSPLTLAVPLLGAGAAAFSAWAVRGRSSSIFGSNLWRGPHEPSAPRRIALTFDDGPSESTPPLLDLLARHSARATFFQCGHHAERLPAIARQVSLAGHEIGNHTYSHPRLYLQSPAFVCAEIARAQTALATIHGQAPKWFRATYGVRWFGMSGALAENHLTHVAWTTIARDWTLPAPAIAARCLKPASPGAILCFHDGRELAHNPDIRPTLDALTILLPQLTSSGYTLVTLTEMFSPNART